MQQNPNKATAERIAKEYGGNAKEIESWLDNHPLVVDGNKVQLEGIDDLSVDISSDTSKKTGDMIANKGISKGYGMLLKKIFGGGLGSVLSSTKSWEQPAAQRFPMKSPNYAKISHEKLRKCLLTLRKSIFKKTLFDNI